MRRMPKCWRVCYARLCCCDNAGASPVAPVLARGRRRSVNFLELTMRSSLKAICGWFRMRLKHQLRTCRGPRRRIGMACSRLLVARVAFQRCSSSDACAAPRRTLTAGDRWLVVWEQQQSFARPRGQRAEVPLPARYGSGACFKVGAVAAAVTAKSNASAYRAVLYRAGAQHAAGGVMGGRQKGAGSGGVTRCTALPFEHTHSADAQN